MPAYTKLCTAIYMVSMCLVWGQAQSDPRTDLPLSLVGARTVVEQLMNSRWLDQATRVIFVDINLFQPVPSKVLMIRMAVEFGISGKVTMRHKCWSYVGWSDVCTSHHCSVDTLNIRLTD